MLFCRSLAVASIDVQSPLLRCAPGKYVSSQMTATISGGDFDGPEWDLKCAKMTKADGADTCQTGADADYAADCARCKAGTYSDRRGSEENKCCRAGTAATVDQCTSCPAGKYQNKTGESACTSCPYRFQTSAVKSKAPSDCYVSCPWGLYASNTTLCRACPSHTNTSTAGSVFDASKEMIADCKCAPGYWAAGSGAGKTCHICEKGKFKSTIDDTNCTSCPAGTSTSATGATSEAECKCLPGYGGSGSGTTAECQQCTAGKFKRSQGTGYCQDCSGGSFSPLGSSACTLCPAGKSSTIKGASACDQCAAGTYQSQLGATACVECGAGTFASSGSDVGQANDTCVKCPAGKYWNSDTTAATNSSVCVDCEAGTYSPPGASPPLAHFIPAHV